jgi:hypothetical protein
MHTYTGRNETSGLGAPNVWQMVSVGTDHCPIVVMNRGEAISGGYPTGLVLY